MNQDDWKKIRYPVIRGFLKVYSTGKVTIFPDLFL